MEIQKIEVSYGNTFIVPDKVFPGQERWEKIGINITISNEADLKEATDMAYKYVNDTYAKNNQSQESNGSKILNKNSNGEDDKKWEELKEAIGLLEFREDAFSFLETTDFRYAVAAKELCNIKPLKNK